MRKDINYCGSRNIIVTSECARRQHSQVGHLDCHNNESNFSPSLFLLFYNSKCIECEWSISLNEEEQRKNGERTRIKMMIKWLV